MNLVTPGLSRMHSVKHWFILQTLPTGMFFFFKIIFFKNSFMEYHQSVNLLGLKNVGPDLGPNCLSADDTSKQRDM